MSLAKQILSSGNGSDYPVAGDDILIAYTGWLYDTNKPNSSYKGRKFDSSASRGEPFSYRLGLGAVIKGWEMAISQMSLGEKTMWVIPAELAYGKSGFPGLIAPNTPLVFELELKAINTKRA